MSPLTPLSPLSHKTTPRPLPPGWKWNKLGELLISLESGSRPKGGALGINNGIPSISAEQMKSNGFFDFSVMRYVPYEHYINMRSGHIQVCDILIVKDGATTGKACFIDSSFPFDKAVVNEHVFICRPDQERVQPELLFFWLWSPEGQSMIQESFQGAAIGGINQKFIHKVYIPLPPLPEQKRIASILKDQLAAVDKARKAAEERLEAIKALPAAFLRKVFPQPGQPLPEGWKWVKLHEVCETTSGGTPIRGIKEYYGGNIPWIKSGELPDGIVSSTEETITEEGIKSSSAKMIPKGTLLMAMYGATVGRVGITNMEATTNQAICAILPNEDLISSFLFYYLIAIRNNLIKKAFGGAMPNISQNVIQNLIIPLPQLTEQKRISEILKEQMAASDKARKAAEEELAAINSLPAAILRKAFNGEI